MNVALDLVKKGEADACVSSGNTGALLSASQLKLKRIKGVLRPAIASVFPVPLQNTTAILLILILHFRRFPAIALFLLLSLLFLFPVIPLPAGSPASLCPPTV